VQVLARAPGGTIKVTLLTQVECDLVGHAYQVLQLLIGH
jgi:hypothetical protein